MLALTMGDPAGIGAEIAAKAWHALRHTGPAFTLLADPAWIAATGTPIHVLDAPNPTSDPASFAQSLPVLPIPLAAPATPGHPDPANAPATIRSIEQAVALVQRGQARAVVTNPISKHVLTATGFPHPGHTEFLGALTGASLPVMMLANQHLRVVPVTIHVSLRQALAQLTTPLIIQTARITAASLRRFGIPNPRLAVAGLNPHAGENGTMGTEETTLIAPAIQALQAEGLDVSGPWPPDTMFTPAARARYDAALCMYHDQALIPLKTLDMSSGVNVTLGLPLVRTSPDHGTAFDIAGQGTADPSSLIAALRMAQDLSS